MTLYEYLKLHESDYDTYDTEYDASVTVCFIDEEDEDTDDYYKFCTNIIKKVNVVRADKYDLTVDWTKLIKDNMAKFKEFTGKHWKYTYEDDKDEFIYQWINEIHAYMAGCVSESFYKVLNEFVDSLE